MEIAIAIVLFAVGIVLIVKGGDYFVDAASWIAEVLGIPQFIVGATVVSLATTLPELIVSIIAAAQGHSLLMAGQVTAALGKVDMAVGNAIGSVIANTGMIMGIAILFAPFAMKRKKFAPQAILLLISVSMLFGLSTVYGFENAFLNNYIGLLLFIPLIAFVIFSIVSGKKDMQATKAEMLTNEGMAKEVEKAEPIAKDGKTIALNIVKFVVGAGFIVGGAQLLVDYATVIAKALSIPEGVIAVTIVAIGTSLPELVTMVTALAKKKGAMSIGNVLGANIIDITMILPICALVYGDKFPVSKSTMVIDFPFCLGIAIIGVLPSLFTKKFQRWQGLLMLAMYVSYLVLKAVLNFNNIHFAI